MSVLRGAEMRDGVLQRFMGRPVLFLTSCAFVMVGTFFLTLWLMEARAPQRAVPAPGAKPAGDRLAAQRVVSYDELPEATSRIGLRFAREMHGNVDSISRVSERDVTIGGWVADLEGDATPNELLVFVAGVLAGRTRTRGERPDVQRTLNLYFDAEKNVAFQLTFPCTPGERPVAVALGKDERYFGLQTPRCP